jgi:tetratricopeptide (TPR) repeat protein
MGIKEVQRLLAQQKYTKAAAELDKLLISKKDNGELWYLRGVASLKLQNYEKTQEYLERALFCGKKAKYYQMQGMAHFEIFDINEAVESFRQALVLEPEDATTNFFLAICYMLLDDQRSAGFLQKALQADSRKTKQLLMNFYSLFIDNDPTVTEAGKKKLLQRIKKI